MIGFSHAVSGAALYLGAAPLLDLTDPRELVIGSTIAMGAAVLPDYDHASARPGKWLGPVTGALAEFTANTTGGHRKGTHSLLAWLLVTISAILAVTFGVQLAVVWFCSGLGLYALRVPRLISIAGAFVVAGYTWWTFETMGSWFWIPLAMSIGYLAHLMGDTLTPEGVPYLYPFSKKRTSLGLFTTGTLIETGLIAPVLALTAGGLLIDQLHLTEAMYTLWSR